MALKLNAGDVGRGDMFFVEPEKVVIVESLRGRSRPPSDAAVVNMAESIRTQGQLQAVVCRRRDQDKKLVLVAGFTRTAAVKLIRKGYTALDGTKHAADKNIKLKVTVTECNEEESRITNIVENVHRNATSDVDDAFNQRWLREQCNWEDAKIAELYQCSPAAVTRLRKVLEYDNYTQDRIHEGTMTIEAASLANRVPKNKRKKIIEEATGENGKVSTAVIREEVREATMADHKDEGEAAAAIETNGEVAEEPAPNGGIALTLHEVRKFVDEESELGEDEKVKKLWHSFALFMAGKRTVKAVRAAVMILARGE